MNVQRAIFASVGIVLLAATAGFAQQVKTEYARSTDFSDANTKKLIRRGSSSDTPLDKEVQKMFDHFPPREKK